MPRFTVTPAILAVTGGEAAFIPVRFDVAAAALSVTGGTVGFGVGNTLSVADDVPTLVRLQRQLPYFNEAGQPTIQMQLHWQSTMEAIEAAFAALSTRVGDNTSLLAQVQAAQALASQASDTANAASDTVNIALGFVDPINVLSAASTGVITIAAHDRVYGDGTSVSVNSGSVSGFLPGDYVSVYYQDSSQEGGAVTYQGTTMAVAQSGNRHVVGQVTIPAVGAIANDGAGVSAPGYIPPDIIFDIPYIF